MVASEKPPVRFKTNPLLKWLAKPKPPNFLSFADSAASALGKVGEVRVATYLEELGWRVLARNWRSGQDEVDLVAIDPTSQDCVIVEVKTFSEETEFEQTVGWNWRKKRALKRAFLALTEYQPDWLKNRGVRIDLIVVTPARLQHFPNVTVN